MLSLQQVLGVMRKMRTEIELSEPQFSELTDLFGISSLIIDTRGVISSINETAAALFGFEARELVGISLVHLVVDGSSAVNGLLKQGLAAGSFNPFELVLRGRSGRRNTVFVVPAPISRSDGTMGSILLMLSETTKRRVSSYALQRSELELQHFVNRLMVGHEVELKRVSSELHDGIGQILAMTKFMVEDASRQVRQGRAEDGVQILEDAVRHLRDVMDEVRRISSELRPSALDDLGLIPAIEGHCRKYEGAYRDIALERNLDVAETEIPAYLKSDIFRIVQEAMNNAARHAGASKVAVSMHSDDGTLILKVRDDGIGFDTGPEDHPRFNREGLGLRSMRERAEATGGCFTVHSALGAGTEVAAKWKL